MYHDDHPMVLGDGAVAVLERCELLVITLFPTIAQAERRLRRLDELGCGGRCEGLHDLVVLLPERDGEPAEAVSPRGRYLG